MVGWHHQFNGHDLEQAPGDSEGQGSLACCSPWGCKELEQQQLKNKISGRIVQVFIFFGGTNCDWPRAKTREGLPPTGIQGGELQVMSSKL